MSKSELDDMMANMSREEMMSALFANLIVQQTNMAFMFLGRVPHPETGEIVRDLPSAKFFIDQVEMLEVKTKGNLTKQEEDLLKQSLTALRMAFVEAVEKGDAPPDKTKAVPPTQPSAEPSAEPQAQPKPDDDQRKKFSKKY